MLNWTCWSKKSFHKFALKISIKSAYAHLKRTFARPFLPSIRISKKCVETLEESNLNIYWLFLTDVTFMLLECCYFNGLGKLPEGASSFQFSEQKSVISYLKLSFCSTYIFLTPGCKSDLVAELTYLNRCSLVSIAELTFLSTCTPDLVAQPTYLTRCKPDSVAELT